jgi:hypothetical protein
LLQRKIMTSATYSKTVQPASGSRARELLREWVAATPLYIFISALRGR